MKALPTVTLIACDGVDAARSARVLNYCASLFKFARIALVTPHQPPAWFAGEWIDRGAMDYAEAMRYEVSGLAQDVDTEHALFVSHDGWIINPQFWDDAWLEYDMIGAPWPASWGTGHRVGNTGFSLRSKTFLNACSMARHVYSGQPGDVFACRTMHRPFVEMGLRYAPVEIARKFSWENYIGEGECGPACSFGFHGWVAGKNRDEFTNDLPCYAT